MNNTSLFILRSLTAVMKAKKLLNEHGIAAVAVKRTSHSGDGCHYGVSVTRGDSDAALEIMKKNGISPLSYER